jgi:biofilm PGA synthesis N-glycosyltransferase PgaC
MEAALLSAGMAVLFWGAFVIVFFAYLGYWLLLRFLPGKAVHAGSAKPSVSILIAARNEASSLTAKLKNLRELDYPKHLIQIVIVSDGSTDDTVSLLEREDDVVLVPLAVSGGKANALNHGVTHATGEILVFFDARQQVDLDAVTHLVSPFADPAVGAVSGELLLESGDGMPTDSLGIYWKIEKAVRRMESETGSVVGVTGAIYAIRRELYEPMPQGLILDDVFIPMYVVRKGCRVLFQPAAIARDRIFAEPGKEFRRKVRTLAGNFQLLQMASWMLSPGNPVLFRLISHKLLRLIVPYLLVVMLIASAMAGGEFFRLVFLLQLLFYGLALLGTLSVGTRRWKPISIATTFIMLNGAAVVALYKYLTGKQVWR